MTPHVGRKLGALASVLTAAIAFAQPPFGGEPSRQSAGHGTTLLPPSVELERLVDLAAERLQIAIAYDPAHVKGTVVIRTTGGLSGDELWSVTNEILASRGFAVIRAPGSDLLRVVKGDEAKADARIEPVEGPAGRQGFASLVVGAEHLDPKRLLDALKPFLSKQGGQAVQIGDTRLILISDQRPRLEQMLELLARIDVPGEPTLIEEVRPQSLGAERLATLVAQVVAKRDAVSGEKTPGDVLTTPDKDAVLVIAPESKMAFWRGLVEQLDRREPVERRTYTLGRAAAFGLGEVATLVESVAQGGPGGADAATEGDSHWQLVQDDLTGTLIVTTTPSRHAQVEEMLQRLERAAVESPRTLRSFPIKNREAAELMSILDGLIVAGALEGTMGAGEQSRDSLGTSATERVPSQPMQPDVAADQPASEPDLPPQPSVGLGEAARPRPSPNSPEQRALAAADLTLTVDEDTNTLIAVGPPALLRQLEDLIVSLDIRQPQVQINVVMVSLSESDTLDFGVELERLEVHGGTFFKVASLFGLSSPVGGSGGGTGGTSSGAPPIGRSVGDATGFSGVILDPGEFSVVVRALETINEGRSVSRPRLLVDNNQDATFDSVVQQPVVSVNAGDTVATTSQTGFEPAGTQITVTPRIANGDHLVLEYAVVQSAFVGESSQPGITPPRQETSVTSVATIPDGFTVIVGGIEESSSADAESRVPVLGSIPLIGELFKNRSKNNNRSRFYVFITAEVMRDQSFTVLKHLSDRDLKAAQIDDGWPTLEPRVIR